MQHGALKRFAQSLEGGDLPARLAAGLIGEGVLIDGRSALAR